MREFPSRWVYIGIVIAALVIVPGAQAQYFGANKVQHKDFAFQVLSTEHFDIYFYPEERQAAGDVARMAERWHARLSALLRHSLRGRQAIVLVPEISLTPQTAGRFLARFRKSVAMPTRQVSIRRAPTLFA